MSQLPQQDVYQQYQQYAGMSNPGNFRPLNVKDALSYLDQVKYQFGNQPEVYNQFLDIMKDFKSQSIDTPGVIHRVSTLFKGHRNLIQGFNAFLPPGYKIEDEESAGSMPPPPPQEQIPAYPSHPMMASLPRQPPPGQVLPQQVPPQVQAYAPQMAHQSPHRKTPVEFDHAISYVNRIKNRFQNKPETYKNFLDILHIYQKEQKSIKEVYDQVAALFSEHPDLLEEFTHFLPESGVPHQQSIQASMTSMGYPGPAAARLPPPPSAPAENFAQNIKKPSSASSKAPSGKQKRVEETSKGVAPPTKKHKSSKGYPPQHLPPQLGHAAPPPSAAVPAPLRESLADQKKRQANLEELEFFEKIKKALDGRHDYTDFLKCLNLFSQEIITRQELIQFASTFLGKNQELMDWFKKFVGYKESPPDTIPPLEKIPVVDYSSCVRYGPSYRALPKHYPHPKCSGRTGLCSETLNDVWVSFPIWSEDAPFLASKKNQHEEAIYRAEDDRYELDRIIEMNAATIKNFEAVHKRVQVMTSEEAQKFRLPNNLGGSSEVIYHQAIKRIYGEKAGEVIDGLKRHPAVAVPIVLGRLRQKDDEWRRAQREWRKVWADVYAKNFYRSLDYQGSIFKQSEKKNLAQRALVQEAEQLYQDQRKGSEALPGLSCHYEASMPDESIFADIFRLINFYLDKAPGLSGIDRDQVLKFNREFVTSFFCLPAAAADTSEPSEATEAPEEMDVDPAPCAPATNGVQTKLNTLYGSGSLFALLRLLQLAYSRLERIKELKDKAPSNPHRFGRGSLVAEKLGLLAPTREVPSNRMYSRVLELIEQFLEGKIDQSRFEDTVREIFGIDAYVIFTIDKLIHAIAKQIQAVTADEKSVELLELYQNGTGKAPQPEVEQAESDQYRLAADKIIGDELCFRICYSKDQHRFTIKVISKEAENATRKVEERWSQYVEQFVKAEPSNHVSKGIYLKRNKRLLEGREEEAAGHLEIQNHLECKICINTYRILFVENSEDFFHRRKSPKGAEKEVAQRSKKRLGPILGRLRGANGSQLDLDLMERECLRLFRGENGITQKIEVTGDAGLSYCKYITFPPVTAPAPTPTPAPTSTSAPSSTPTPTPTSTSAPASASASTPASAPALSPSPSPAIDPASSASSSATSDPRQAPTEPSAANLPQETQEQRIKP